MSVLTKNILPFILAFIALVLAALALDVALHLSELRRFDRWLGPIGSGLLLVSFGYSARKRRWTKRGKLPTWLRLHEWLAWLGVLVLLVHSGVHFNALLPWAATALLLVVTASGLVGKFLLQRARSQLKTRKGELEAQGLTPEAIEERLALDSLAYKALAQWRRAHLPLVATFLGLAGLHAATGLWFWSA